MDKSPRYRLSLFLLVVGVVPVMSGASSADPLVPPGPRTVAVAAAPPPVVPRGQAVTFTWTALCAQQDTCTVHALYRTVPEPADPQTVLLAEPRWDVAEGLVLVTSTDATGTVSYGGDLTIPGTSVAGAGVDVLVVVDSRDPAGAQLKAYWPGAPGAAPGNVRTPPLAAFRMTVPPG
jgi:hypothetical protein